MGRTQYRYDAVHEQGGVNDRRGPQHIALVAEGMGTRRPSLGVPPRYAPQGGHAYPTTPNLQPTTHNPPTLRLEIDTVGTPRASAMKLAATHPHAPATGRSDEYSHAGGGVAAAAAVAAACVAALLSLPLPLVWAVVVVELVVVVAVDWPLRYRAARKPPQKALPHPVTSTTCVSATAGTC